MVSDHDLFRNMANDMKQFIKDNKIFHAKPGRYMLALGMKRRNLYECFRRLCRSVIFNIQLPYTPNSVNKKKPESVYKKQRITKEDVKNASDKQFEDSKKRKLDDEDDEPEDPEEGEEPEFVDKCTDKMSKKKSSSDKSVASTTSSKRTDSLGISIHQDDIVQLKIDDKLVYSIKLFKTSINPDDSETKTYLIEVNNEQIRMIITNNKLIVDKDIDIPT